MRHQGFASKAWIVLFAALGLSAAPLLAPRLASPAVAQQGSQDQTISEEDVVSGTMDIQFNTRTNQDSCGDLLEGSAAIGAMDNYMFSLAIAKTTEFEGQITRQPNLYTK